MNSKLIKTALGAIGTFWNDTIYKVDNLFGGHFQEGATFNHDEQQYAEFLAKFQKQYETKTEYEFRFGLFRENLQRLDKINKEDPGSVGVNKFSDWTRDELDKYRGKKNKKKPGMKPKRRPHNHPLVERETYKILPTDNIPKSFNWVDHVKDKDPSAVIPMRNQGECGSCWAFTTAAALEFYNWQAGGDFFKLSVQQLLDCDRDYDEEDDEEYGNAGCEGGNVEVGFEYTAQNPVVQENYYPYEYHGVKEKNIENNWECESKLLKLGNRVQTSGKYLAMKPRDPEQLKAAIMEGPVAIAIDCDSDECSFHQGDKPIRSVNCGGQTGHAVLAVGFGHYDGDSYPTDYVIIKNSYGDDWGKNGYGKISLSQRHRSTGVCGALEEGFWTVVDESKAATK